VSEQERNNERKGEKVRFKKGRKESVIEEWPHHALLPISSHEGRFTGEKERSKGREQGAALNRGFDLRIREDSKGGSVIRRRSGENCAIGAGGK